MPGETVLVVDDSPTILKVVQLVLTRAGFSVTTAADGEAGLEAARSRKPHMILLDFVMPRLNGYQFCRALAGDAELKDVPIVLMSAKGDQVGERFVKVMGIVDYITKPFSPEAITAVVQHTVGKHAKGAASDSQPLVIGADEVSQIAAPQGAPTADEVRRRVLDEARQAIARAVASGLSRFSPASTSAPGDQAAGGGALADAARAALDDDFLLGVLASARPALDEACPPEPALKGDLRVVPIAEVLQLLQLQGQSGILQVTRSKGEVTVCFRQGKVDYAHAAGVSDEFLLGRFIVDLKLMSQDDLDTFLRSRIESGKLFGAQLVKLGYVSDSELKLALAKQTSELIYEILRWNFGRFSFRATRDLPPLAVDASLGLAVDGILMEGFRRVDEWHLIEREIDNFDLVFLRNEDAIAQMGRGRLTREELAILELVNGKNTVKEIVRQSRMGSFDVSKMLYRLLSIKLIRRRVMPVAV